MSPTSLKVVHRQIKVGKKIGFKETFELEYKLSQEFMRSNDFFEGVRALLVDKDKNPKWKPTTVQEVTKDMVDKYFMAPDKWI